MGFYGNVIKYLEKAFSHFHLVYNNSNEKPQDFSSTSTDIVADEFRDYADITFGNRWIQAKNNGNKENPSIIIQHGPPDSTIANQLDDTNIIISTDDGDITNGAIITTTNITHDYAGHVNGKVSHDININIKEEKEIRKNKDDELDKTIKSEQEKLQKLTDTVANEIKRSTDKDNIHNELLTTLISTDKEKSVRTIANEELAKQLIPEGAEASMDELKEIAAWIQKHPKDAADMNKQISANTSDIVKLTTSTNNNAQAIEALKKETNTNKSNIETNKTNISVNAGNIKLNSQNINSNKTNIEINKANIETNTANIGINAKNIETNRVNIATNRVNIATNKTNIETNKSNIETNKSNIETNKTNININSRDIAQNTKDISNIKLQIEEKGILWEQF